jgi:hypothetical protein
MVRRINGFPTDRANLLISLERGGCPESGHGTPKAREISVCGPPSGVLHKVFHRDGGEMRNRFEISTLGRIYAVISR